MVKLGCLILSMVETNLVGRVNLFLLVMGWAMMLIHHSYAILIILHINRLSSMTYLQGDFVEFLFNLYTCVFITFLVASGFGINLGCYTNPTELVAHGKPSSLTPPTRRAGGPRQAQILLLHQAAARQRSTIRMNPSPIALF